MAQKMTREQIREKYMNMLHTVGVDQAITAIHIEIGTRAEQKVFDGGYDKTRLDEVTWMRELARDLYDYKTAEASKIYKENK